MGNKYLNAAAERLATQLRSHDDVIDAWHSHTEEGTAFVSIQVRGSALPRDVLVPFQTVHVEASSEERTELTGELTTDLSREVL